MALISKSFQDFSLTFEKNAVTDDVLTLRNEAAIKASVKNIVLYNFYEKPFNPGFGGNIIALLFENNTPDLVADIEETIEEVINVYEPRVEVNEVEALFDEDINDLQVRITYTILGIPPKIDNLELAFRP